MNKELLFLTELDDNKVEQLLAYSSYNDNSLDSIKSKVKQKTASKRIRGVKRIFIIAAVLILGAGAVVAATVDFDRAYQFLFGTQAEFMHDHGHHKGIVKEADGIEIELVSVMRYEHELVMIVAVRDTIGDRLDQTTFFIDRLKYVENGIKNELQFAGRMNEFDEQTQTYLSILTYKLNECFKNKELRLIISQLASKWDWIDGYTEVFDKEWIIAFESPSEMESLTIPINETILIYANRKLFAEKFIITPLGVELIFLAEDGRPLTFRADDHFENFYDWPFLTYDDGTALHLHFNLRQHTPALPCPYNQRREIRFRHDRQRYLLKCFGINRAIELDKIQSFTIQDMEFKVD